MEIVAKTDRSAGETAQAASRINRRLAARFHQAKATGLVRADRLAGRMRGRIQQLVRRLLQTVQRKRLLATVPELVQQAAWWQRELEAWLEGELARLARQSYQQTARTLLEVVPGSWVLGRGSWGVQESAGDRRKRPTKSKPYSRPPRPKSQDPSPSRPYLDIRYDWLQRELSPQQARRVFRRLLFPPLEEKEVRRLLYQKPPGGLSWRERLQSWSRPVAAAMATELTQGISQGESLPQLRRRLQPLADGLAWKAQRIARTEASRVQERATLEATRRMGGELLAAFQVVAVLDQNTRPHHAARHGRLYRQGPDGQYRSSQGELLPDLPDEPNCRCMAVPVLRPPKKIAPEFWQQADQEWEKGQAGGLVPEVDDMAQWWQKASPEQRRQAVGAQRYRRMKELLGREPKWQHFIDPQGKLMSIEDLLAESPAQRNRRLGAIRKMLVAQRRAYRDASRLGTLWPYRRLPTHQDLDQLWKDVFPRWRKMRNKKLRPEELGDQTRWAKFSVVDKDQAGRIRDQLRRHLERAQARGDKLRQRLLSQLMELDLENYEHVLQGENLVHMLNEHGPGQEKGKGHIPLQKRHVVQLLPRVVQQFDSVSLGDTGSEENPKEWVKQNRLRIELHRRGKSQVIHYVIEVDRKNRRLLGVTMYVTSR